jgi:sulfur carrier protein
MHETQHTPYDLCRLTVNGTVMELPVQTTIAALLVQQDMAERRLAVEVNGTVVPRSQHDTVQLKDGDRVEIIQAIGGG